MVDFLLVAARVTNQNTGINQSNRTNNIWFRLVYKCPNRKYLVWFDNMPKSDQTKPFFTEIEAQYEAKRRTLSMIMEEKFGPFKPN